MLFLLIWTVYWLIFTIIHGCDICFNFTGIVCNAKKWNAKKWNVKKTSKRKLCNAKLQNVKINIEIMLFWMFCTFLYSKKTSNHEIPNYKTLKWHLNDVSGILTTCNDHSRTVKVKLMFANGSEHRATPGREAGVVPRGRNCFDILPKFLTKRWFDVL